jgi:hypothetical protein
MEFTAIALTEPRGATPGQAVALAMSIRLGQIFWNLVAGLFVLRGGYHAPTATEQDAFEAQVKHDAEPAPEDDPEAVPLAEPKPQQHAPPAVRPEVS